MAIKSVSPAGHRVLVKPDVIEEKSSGGIILAHENKGRVQQAQVTGTIVEIGPNAWKDFSDGTPWAKKGDRVLFAKFGGYEIKVKGELHRVMNDEDITAIVQEDDENA
jgi:chaperonin GroES